MAASNGKNFKVIGTRPIRHDGVDKVTGRAKYGADYAFPDMLFGKMLRSPYAHARIKSINTDKAKALPGVMAVMTAADLPDLPDRVESAGEAPINVAHLTQNLMARDKVLYNGHALAAVCATSPHIAEEAVALIEVDYEILPPVMTVEEAMKPGATILLPNLRNKEEGDKQTNVASHLQFKRGDVAEGFKSADYVVEREFKTAMVHQGYIEPHNAVAMYNSDGKGTIWCSTQGTFAVRGLSAAVAGIPEQDIKVVPAEIGGGFGGKLTIYLEPIALVFSKMTGKPVKMVMSRADVLRATGPTSGSTIRCKMGCTKDGKLVAAQVWMAYEAGAYPGSPVGAGAMTIIAPYVIPNMIIDAYDVVVNRPKTAAYRAPGATNAAMASETIIDELAEMCGIDPADFRLQNAVAEGAAQTAGPPYKKIGFVETLEALKNTPHYKSKLEGPYRGRGVASGFWFNIGLQSSAVVNLHGDGTASLVIGSIDIGGTRAAQAMVAAEVLGIGALDVRPQVADTDTIGYTDVTGGSRTAVTTGVAVFQAAEDAVRQLKERAAKLWEKKPEEIAYTDGVLSTAADPSKKLTLKEIAKQFARTGGPITGRANVNVRGVGPSFATTCVDVEVDPDTGKVKILRATCVQDVGKALHPSYVEGQIQGGTAQGIGWALNEEYVYDDKGILRNFGLLDYRMPTCLDLPEIETVLVEVPAPGHPIGSRGVGEVPIVPPVAAVANAIARATGIRMEVAPMSPPRLLKALLKKRNGADSQAAAAGR
ncbi:MAG TPA: xanthine dehydrogenase family protein molybdopterin-binding subunit [Candidatus Binataceae bacterium]|nr:xanthine dehydrogenase family protein molybdopterin-binding subunit [Candidatus Binataceae bacterium]